MVPKKVPEFMTAPVDRQFDSGSSNPPPGVQDTGYRIENPVRLEPTDNVEVAGRDRESIEFCFVHVSSNRYRN